MAASGEIAEGNEQRLAGKFVVDLSPAAALSAEIAFCFVCGILLLRRCASGMTQPLPAGGLLAAALVAIVFGWLLRWRLVACHPRVFSASIRVDPWGFARLILPGAFAFLLTAVLLLPGTSPWVGAAALLLALLSEIAWWIVWRRNQAQTAPSTAAGLATVEGIDENCPADVMQQLIRRRDATGGETIAGMVRVDFSSGERLQIAHLSFCPPLTAVPELSVETAEGPEAAVRVTLVQTYGARLEVKLNEASPRPTNVVLRVFGEARR